MVTIDEEKIKLLELIFGMRGQILDNTKSNRDTVYNGNIVIGETKYWWGDFRGHWKWKLRELAILLKQKIYVLREMDARFETEEKPKLERAVYAFDEEGKEIKIEKKSL